MTAAGQVLSGRKAVITGANRGLGLEIARHFLAEGADVAMGARDAVLLETEAASQAQRGERFPRCPLSRFRTAHLK